jgi:response regulator RpfG family c-di-GMP phosphodiesterase
MGTVLVVDDLAGNCRLLESLLAPDGHVVRTARDGDEAVRAVHDAPPDLVLMDVMMPGVDGFEACRMIKQNPGTRLTPGYPDGLRGEAIPLLAQILGIVDVFDALMTERPYKAALPFAQAAEELRDEAACGWRRADLVAGFLDQVAFDDRRYRAS